ncbi:MAG: hypothetical protein GTN71_01590, partial [Anaerolineae bacterium]|nr:hypothetical protein [Burkholderiales bacterium]NIO67774.1 hypothetical protein [Anaerolineae bacterium]
MMTNEASLAEDAPLTREERAAVGRIFSALWAGAELSGSWKFSAYRDHGNYIRRGPLLLRGDCHRWSLAVLVPPDATVTPAPIAPASHFSPAPKVDGEVIDPQNEPG